MGKGSNIGDNSIIDTSDDVIIGDQVALGPFDIVYTHDHDYHSDSFDSVEGWGKNRKGCRGRWRMGWSPRHPSSGRHHWEKGPLWLPVRW